MEKKATNFEKRNNYLDYSTSHIVFYNSPKYQHAHMRRREHDTNTQLFNKLEDTTWRYALNNIYR